MVELTAISLLVTTCGAAVVAIITAIQNSRCTKINACCITCDRSMPHEQEQGRAERSGSASPESISLSPQTHSVPPQADAT